MSQPKVHTIYLPGDGADDNTITNIMGTRITNFYGTKLEGVTSFKLHGSVDDPYLMAAITLRVPVRVKYQDAK